MPAHWSVIAQISIRTEPGLHSEVLNVKWLTLETCFQLLLTPGLAFPHDWSPLLAPLS